MVTKIRTDKQYRLRPETMKLVNKLDKSRKKSPNMKIFDLLGELERRRYDSQEVMMKKVREA